MIVGLVGVDNRIEVWVLPQKLVVVVVHKVVYKTSRREKQCHPLFHYHRLHEGLTTFIHVPMMLVAR